MWKNWPLWLILLVVVLTIIILITGKAPSSNVDMDIVKCIGEKSTLCTQLGCHACEVQEELFGENYQYLDIIDCFFDSQECVEIQATPTWKIKGETYVGIQSIEILKELTGC